ncbi:cation diffusion facilitator CzcD-associated flavoprotein CzcO [Actinocorallia herbida]|uniref:Cation diffusion facilitator CzcD-associated flavoprotein CzcO n=1 Tax=Actinocorallia herbida TaxID=58109 RepID=A0A3N1CXH9_9ACTN|nr:NAD(P)/FAD-dependent oxidoreductase [Actinocorallia herbida]ROO86002.1 cation diffusion facilitator CzcD-associated flavoprotein CzcO [Actinocorallia herbida]
MPEHEVVVIGAGISGIGMGIALRRAGIEDFVILERAAAIGGTWRDNTYPGIGVDVPAQAYQFSYAPNPGWSRVFAPGHEVRSYVEGLADRFRLRPHLRLGTEVVRRDWDEELHLWRLTTSGGEITARFVVSAIGAFVEPKPVDIPGIEDFRGDVLRSASWDHTVPLDGRRAAIVGTGASAVQIIPEIARRTAHLDVYQRTPIWIAPKPDAAVPAALRRLYARAPRFQEAVRRAATRGVEYLLIDSVVRHRPAVTARLERLLRDTWYRTQVRDPETRAKLVPDYGFGCKRPSVSNAYLRTFNRPDVALVTDPIERVTPTGLRTKDGTEHPADVLILATGFRLASDPEVFRRTPVRGRDGFDLAERYATERLASYEGVTQPGLPNHFMMFGPYGWVGGTWHQLVETTAAHVVRVLGEARRRGATAVEVRPEAAARWTGEMRGRLGGSVFHGRCATARSYYFDHHGDLPYLRPTSSAQAREAAASFPLDDYLYETRHA